MSNTEKRRSQESGVRSQKGVVVRRVFFCLLTSVSCLLLLGCRMDMQDQPKYKTYRAGDEKFGVKGASVRPLVEGTVPRRGAGADYRDADDYFYTGKTAGQAGSTSGGAAAPAVSTSAALNSLASGGALGAGNTAGGGPRAPRS